MRKAVLILLACVLFFCSCGQDQEPKDVITFKSTMPVVMTGSSIDITNTYRSSYFTSDSGTFNKDLALLSFAMTRADVNDAFSKMQFDTRFSYENSDDYMNRCSYFFAHRTVGDNDLIAVVVNWSGYNVEWAGNFQVGEKKEGERSDHNGFDLASEWVYDNLLEYIDTYFKDRNLKIWISGYSRGGAIVDSLAFKVIENGEINVSQDNLFVYAFEPSASIDEGFEEPYSCIHNVVNAPDVIASTPPAPWNFARPGVDTDISTDPDTLNRYLEEVVGKGVSMPAFTPDPDNYKTPYDFLVYFMNLVTEQESATLDANYIDLIDEKQTDNGYEPISSGLRTYLSSLPTSESPAGFKDRETFVSTVQDRLVYLLNLFMKDSRKGLQVLSKAISDLIKEKGEAYLLTLFTGDEFYNLTSDAFRKNNVPFDDEELKTNCSLAAALGANGKLISALLSLVMDENKLNNIKYIILSHYPEVIYALLKNC